MPQQELAQAMAGTMLILTGVFARPHQVTQRLRAQPPAPTLPSDRQLDNYVPREAIAAVDFDSIAGLDWNLRGWDHFTGHSQTGQLPIQNVISRTGFVKGSSFATSFRTASRRLGSRRSYGLPRPVQQVHGGGVRVDIQTNKSYLGHATNSPFVCGSAPQFVSHSQHNPDIANRGWSPHCD
jgi:hypothetical protein